MNENFHKAIEMVLNFEGGSAMTDDPDDSGGLTKFGIALNHNPDVDVANLKEKQAIDIYRQKYWFPAGCDNLPDGLDLVVFDMAVNHGVNRAVKELQRSLTSMIQFITAEHRENERFAPLSIDGQFGTKTMNFVLAWEKTGTYSIELLKRDLMLRRARFYVLLAKQGSQRKYLFGWLRQRIVNLCVWAGIFNRDESI